jgi:hypothetical protein
VLRPFDDHFTAEGIIKSWISVGFLPMMGNAVNDPKVRHELGDGGAPPEAAICMKALSVEYRKTARVYQEVQCVAWRSWEGHDMGRAHGGRW